jgi:hypothetical protein
VAGSLKITVTTSSQASFSQASKKQKQTKMGQPELTPFLQTGKGAERSVPFFDFADLSRPPGS